MREKVCTMVMHISNSSRGMTIRMKDDNCGRNENIPSLSPQLVNIILILCVQYVLYCIVKKYDLGTRYILFCR